LSRLNQVAAAVLNGIEYFLSAYFSPHLHPIGIDKNLVSHLIIRFQDQEQSQFAVRHSEHLEVLDRTFLASVEVGLNFEVILCFAEGDQKVLIDDSHYQLVVFHLDLAD